MCWRKKTIQEFKCFEERLPGQGYPLRRPLGLQVVPLKKIVGSVGRCREGAGQPPFNPFAKIRRPSDRMRSIMRALERGAILPPVDLYKVGDEYFILDGHHRVAAGRRIGQLDIDANVTEFLGEAEGSEREPLDEALAAREGDCVDYLRGERHAYCTRLDRLRRDVE